MISRLYTLRSASKNIKSSFAPSLTALERIFSVLEDENSVTRTALSQMANIHYSRLVQHLKWLQHKNIVQSFLDDELLKIRFTARGREFARVLIEGNLEIDAALRSRSNSAIWRSSG